MKLRRKQVTEGIRGARKQSDAVQKRNISEVQGNNGKWYSSEKKSFEIYIKKNQVLELKKNPKRWSGWGGGGECSEGGKLLSFPWAGEKKVTKASHEKLSTFLKQWYRMKNKTLSWPTQGFTYKFNHANTVAENEDNLQHSSWDSTIWEW